MDEEQSRPDEAPATWPELGSALDDREGPAATADNLRGILVRHTRRRRRLATGIAATVVTLGVGGGAAVGAVVASSGGVPTAMGRTSASATTISPPLAIGAPGSGVNAKNATGTASSNAGMHVFSGEPAAPSNGSSGGASGGSNAASSTASTVPGPKGASPLAPAHCGVNGGCPSYVPPYGTFFPMYGHLGKVFDRTANGVTIRAFTIGAPYGYPIYPAIGGAVEGGAAFGGGSSSSGGAPASTGSASAGTGSASAGTGSASAGTGSASAGTGSVTTASTTNPVHGSPPPVQPICTATQELLVEVSDAGAVGQFVVPSPARPSSAIAYVDDQIIGTAEGSPIAVVAVRVGSQAATVEARFGTGTYDQMAVVDGWAVLADSLSSSANTAKDAAANVVVLDSSNKQIGQVNISQAPSYAVPEMCIFPMRHPMMPPPATGAPNMPAGAPSSAPPGPPTIPQPTPQHSSKIATSSNKSTESK